MPQQIRTVSSESRWKKPIRANEQICKQLLVSPQAFTTSLLTILLDRLYDPQDEASRYKPLEWSPEVRRQELIDEFGVKPLETNLTKLNIGAMLVTSDLFGQSLPHFTTCVNILAGDDDVTDGDWDYTSPEEMAWAVFEASLLNPDWANPESYSEEIRYYIGSILNHEGFMSPPSLLKMAKYDDNKTDPAYELSDDPEFVATLYQTQDDRNKGVQEAIRETAKDLFNQLKDLQVAKESLEQIVQEVMKQISSQ